MGAAESPSATYPLPSRCSISNRLWPETVRFDLLKLRFVSENRIEKTVQDAGLAPLFVNFCTRFIYTSFYAYARTVKFTFYLLASTTSSMRTRVCIPYSSGAFGISGTYCTMHTTSY